VTDSRDAAHDAPNLRIPFAVLAIACVYAAATQFAILSQALDKNPFAQTPINDAAVYWNWAGEIARGRLVDSTPFNSAPLYPYLLGLARFLGASIAGAFALQAVLHIATIVVLFRVGWKRFSPAVGAVAAAIYALLQEPAFFTGRFLNSTLQAFVVVVLWDRALALERALDSGARSVRLPLVVFALMLGVTALANPTFMPGLVLAAVWVYWRSGRGRLGITRGLATLVLSAAAVAPATLHNFLASGEFIPVSVQGGLAFYHGNSSGAVGTYKPVPGISADRTKQNVDAHEMLKSTTDGSWRAASAYYFDKGLEFWKSDPLAGLWLFARKIHWFFSARHYGDIYLPALEIEEGLATALRSTPMPLAWWTICALLTLAILLESSRRYLIEAVLVAAPFLTVTIFFYSPRYRFPVVPVVCVLGAYAVVEIARRSGSRARSIALATSIALGVLLGPLNRSLDFDGLDMHRASFQQLLGTTLASEGKLQEAALHYRRAHELGDSDAAASLGDVLRRLGRDNEALTVLRDATRERPGSAFAHRSLAVALAQRGDLEDAESEFRAALRLDPNDWESLSGIGNVHSNRGEFAQAIERYGEALRLNSSFASARFNLGGALMGAKRWADAEASFRAALALDPKLVQARAQLAELLTMRGDFAGAVNELRAALAQSPDQDALRIDLAWHLATAPDASVRNGAESLRIADELNRATNSEDPLILDTLGAALAENGRFDDAEKSVARAIELLGKELSPAELSEFVARRDLYHARQPFRQTRP
jgi:Flp pilus assembly protein TadD